MPNVHVESDGASRPWPAMLGPAAAMAHVPPIMSPEASDVRCGSRRDEGDGGGDDACVAVPQGAHEQGEQAAGWLSRTQSPVWGMAARNTAPAIGTQMSRARSCRRAMRNPMQSPPSPIPSCLEAWRGPDICEALARRVSSSVEACAVSRALRR